MQRNMCRNKLTAVCPTLPTPLSEITLLSEITPLSEITLLSEVITIRILYFQQAISRKENNP